MTTPAPAAPASEPAPAPAPAATQTPPPAPAAPAPTPQPPASAPQVTEPQDVASLPAWAQQEIRDARTEAARYRTQARDAQAQQAPPAPTDAPEGDVSRLPRWAQTQVTAGQDATRQLALQQAVITHAPAAGVDIARVLDSQSAMAGLAAVDPTDATAVSAALTAALTTHPHLGITPAGPPRGGSDFTTQAATVTADDFARMSYRDRVELRAADPDLYRRLADN